MNPISTKIFTIKPAVLIGKIRNRWLRRWCFLIILCFAVTGVAALFDIRFLFVLLIELFILLPLAMLNVWLKYALKTNVTQAVIPHTVSLDDNNLIITYHKTDTYSPKNTQRTIKLSDIIHLEVTDTYLCIVYGKSPDAIELVALSAFDSMEHRQRFILMMPGIATDDTC